MAYDGSVVMEIHQGLQTEESAFLIETLLNEAQKNFELFIKKRKQNNIILYRSQLIANASRNEYYLNVDIEDLSNYDEILSVKLRNHPMDIFLFLRKLLNMLTLLSNSK